MGSYQVLAGESGAVVENVLFVGDSCLSQKSTENLKAAFNGSGVAALASQKTQQDFGMQVLADFVDHADILQQWLGFITGERDGLIAFQRTWLAIVIFDLVVSAGPPTRCGRRHAASGKGGEFGGTGAVVSANDPAASPK